MKLLLIFLTALSTQGQITYPVSSTNLFTFKLDGEVRRNVRWPRADGMELVSAPTNLVILQQFISPLPLFTNTSHKLSDGIWVDNTNTQTATLTNQVVPLSVAESNAVLLANTRLVQANNLSNAVATLRVWADQAETTTVTSGNAVATLQTVVSRLGVFFDNFADLLEVQGIK
jgi:hypothetical protein